LIRGRELSDRAAQLDAIDGLRGFAALAVFLSHTSLDRIFLFPSLDCSGIGKSGVFLFFVLSSFLLTLPFIKRDREAFTAGFLANYIFRRFARIYPMLFCYALCGLVTTLVFVDLLHFGPEAAVPYLMRPMQFFQEMALMRAHGITWTILIEFRYYLLLPALVFSYVFLFRSRLLPSITLTAAFIGGSQILWPASASTVNDPRVGPYLPLFLMGSLLALIYHRWQESAVRNNKAITLAIQVTGIFAFLALICMTPALASFIIGKELPFDYNHRDFITFGALWCIVVFACLVGRSILGAFFELGALRYFGFISFSVYLLHMPVLIAVETLQQLRGIPLIGWWVLIVTVALSHATWHFIEKPASRLKLVDSLTANQQQLAS
jgi:peptidoglycan/LPS O-acetylase OafA/YrhL